MNATVDTSLARAVARFIDEQAEPSPPGPASPGAGDEGRRRLALEAYNLAGAMIDADGLHTDAELWAFIHALGEHFTDVIAGDVTPGDVRAARLLDGRRSWLDAPSPFFLELVALDRAEGTARARRYYDLAMGLARTVVSLDEYTSRVELTALGALRTTLVEAMRSDGPVAGTPGTPAAGAAAAAGAGVAVVGEELPPPRPLEELLAELDELIGLAAVKEEVRLVADLLQVQKLRRDRGLPVVESSRHLVFVGNPGTGKSTVARLLAQIYRTLEVVQRGQLVETDRAGLVAGYVGQTALKVTEVFDRADEGVLLIDEAYSLVRGGERDFGREAIDAIVKLVEDRRDRVVVIMAGYPDEMAELIDANPGLRSRFPKTIEFPDYTDVELVAIFEQIADRNAYRLDDSGRAAVVRYVEALPRGKGFGNGRAARNLFEAAIARHARRVVQVATPSDDQLTVLTGIDVPVPGAAEVAGLGTRPPLTP